MAPSSSDVIVHPERFDPQREPRKLIAAEHRLRYLWASQVVAGKEVLDAGCGLAYGTHILASADVCRIAGVDIDRAAIEEARRRVPEVADALRPGDIRDLRFDDDSFDVVVCFETIEHVEEPERALFEFRRVLRPGGLLLVSSPNPDVYPAGNEHHVREYRPAELAGAVAEYFRNVGSYSQAAWLTSGIEPTPGEDEDRSNGSGHRVRAWNADPLEAGHETFTIIAATDGVLPQLASCVAFAGAFEVKWWSERVDEAKRDSEGAVAEVERDARQLLAQAGAREAELVKRLEKTGRALVDANQELAQVPLLKHRLAELHEEHAHLWARFNEIESSRSWRSTAPLRRFRAFFRLGRHR
ncbi:MAG: class I SAM-dependent methyltransferase [Solirubrobacterales bacterium]